jgi:hypothetical protein
MLEVIGAGTTGDGAGFDDSGGFGRGTAGGRQVS